MISNEWYYAQNDERRGPVSLETLRAMLANNTVKSGDFVWCAGMTDWEPAGTIAELARPAAGEYTPPLGVATPTAQAGPAMMGYYNSSAKSANAVLYAGFWMRFAAAIVDGIILWVVGLIITLGINAMTGPIVPSRGARGVSTVNEFALMGNCFSFIIQVLYYSLQESSAAQATLGKRVVGIRVTNQFGDRISYGQALGRFFGKYVSAIILGIGYFMAGWTERKQALHDIMAGTLVVRNS